MATIEAVGATAEVNGVRLAFDDTGGDGPVVLLSHGFLMDRTMFDDQVAALRHEYRVITWDERGFGQTVYDERPFTYWDSARDCLALMEHLEIERAVLGGMSQGGFIALRAALLDPDRVRGLILLSTQAGPEDADVIPVYQGMIDAWLEAGPSTSRRRSAPSSSWAIPNCPPCGRPCGWSVLPRSCATPPRRWWSARGSSTACTRSPCPRWWSTAPPTRRSRWTRPQRMADGLVGCSGVVAVEGGTHAANMTHPDQVNAAILDFLAGLPD